MKEKLIKILEASMVKSMKSLRDIVERQTLINHYIEYINLPEDFNDLKTEQLKEDVENVFKTIELKDIVLQESDIDISLFDIKQVLITQDMSKDFIKDNIEEISEYFEILSFMNYLKFTPEESIELKKVYENFDLSFITLHKSHSFGDDFIEENKDILDWSILTINKHFDKDSIEKYKDYINWEIALCTQDPLILIDVDEDKYNETFESIQGKNLDILVNNPTMFGEIENDISVDYINEFITEIENTDIEDIDVDIDED